MAGEWSHKVEAMDMPHELEELMILSIESVVHNGNTNALIRGMMVRVSDAYIHAQPLRNSLFKALP
ncbi:hypothetical protein SCLCIDRAFT_1225489 [Scleroderma citrinum Foug A]|uniref:Uncharacterized protein n=1 Tax=Scleroderma citrinum Foug A TaxID=1036808 RepID=A0A0C3CNF2_9AGAM|nr:hypothetical protein SCLCIDRAFT_1225489 [Scleroderma citrinum Foug A]